MKHLPAWYKLFIEHKIKKLETALSLLNLAEKRINSGFPYLAEHSLNNVKHFLKS